MQSAPQSRSIAIDARINPLALRHGTRSGARRIAPTRARSPSRFDRDRPAFGDRASRSPVAAEVVAALLASASPPRSNSSGTCGRLSRPAASSAARTAARRARSRSRPATRSPFRMPLHSDPFPRTQDHSEARDVQSHDLPAWERKRRQGRSMHRGTLGRFDLARRHPPIGSCKLRDPRGSTTLLRVRVHATPRWSLRPARRLIPIAVVSLARRRLRARACHRARGTTAIRITRRGAAGPGSAPSRSRRSRPECRASRAAWAPSSALRDRPARRATAESPASRRRRRTRAP